MNPALVSKTTTKFNGENCSSSRDSIKNLCKKFESSTKSQHQQSTKKMEIEDGTMKLTSSNIRKDGRENLMRKETKGVNSNSRNGADKKVMKRSPPQKLVTTQFRDEMMMAAPIGEDNGIGTAVSPYSSNDSCPSPSVAILLAKFASSSNSCALDSTFSPSSSAYASTAAAGIASNHDPPNYSVQSDELANSTLNTSNDAGPSSSTIPPISKDTTLKPPLTKPKPKIPPKPPKFANSFGKKMESKEAEKGEMNEIGTQKLETSQSTTMARNSEGGPTVESNLESSLRPFSRANSIRRPKCKPPNPVESTNSPSKCAEVGKTKQSTIVRKPSSRPPPPPVQKNATNRPNFARGSVALPPSLPSNPPPPPPVQTQICQNPCKLPLATLATGSIYEEIEGGDYFEEERANEERTKQCGKYTPKFRKKDGANNGVNQREWANRGKGRAQRRRTTQLDNVLWDGHTEEENDEGDLDDFGEGNSNEPTNGFGTSMTAQNPSSSPLCHSMFVPSSSSGESGRIGAGLKQNLAKGMGKLRSRVSAFTSIHQLPSTVAKTFIQDNFRTLTLGRTKSERMPNGIGTNSKLADRRGRALSTFYLEEERSDQLVEYQQNQLELEENSSAELFGDDWSSSEEEEENEEAIIEEQKTTIFEENASPSLHQHQQQLIPSHHSPAFISTCQSQSLLAEIESEYQRLQLGRKKRKEEEEERKLLESGKGIEETNKMPTSADHQTILIKKSITKANNESPLSPTTISSNSPQSPIPSSSFNSSLPDRQPLYQIYLLQREQQRLNKFVGSTNAAAEEATPAAHVLLEPIGEIPQYVTTKILALEKEKGGTDEVDSVCCPDTSGESEGSAGSSSAHHSLVRRNSSSTTADSGRADSLPLRPLRRERLLGQSVYGSQRSLWCELPEVKESGLLERMDDEQKKQQEAYFEHGRRHQKCCLISQKYQVITSEASYLRSISFLISHFMSAPEFSDFNKSQKSAAISYADKKQLFSNILAIRDCSERLLSELEQRMKQGGLVLSDICDILCTHFESHFEPYVNYCSNQVYQDRTLRKLKTDCPAFIACVQRLETDRKCQGLDMRSFLMLPMQRITRYPLLIEAILIWLQPDKRQHSVATRALTLANQVVRNCNEGARRMERTEQLLDIESRLVYKCAELKRIALVSNGRYVVKSGQLTQLAEKTIKPKLGPSRRLQARPVAFFLFNDMVLIAKRRMNGQFVCKDYAFRRFVVLEPMEPSNLRVPPGIQSALGGRSPHLLSCILLQNARGRQAELLLTAESESDRERWLSAFRPPSCANPDEKIYAEWDCPQALAVHSYEATQEDELSLCPGDLVNILRKMSDGWFYGERIRDKKAGWCPSSYVQQVMNDHVRAQNYRERLRIMQSASEFRTIHQSQQGGKRASLAAPFSSSVASSPHSTSLQSQQESPQILSRFRRLSNPRAYFSRLE